MTERDRADYDPTFQVSSGGHYGFVLKQISDYGCHCWLAQQCEKRR